MRDHSTHSLVIIRSKNPGKGKLLPGHEGPEGNRCITLLFLQPRRLDGGGWSTPCHGRFTPWKDPVPIVQETGWASGPVWAVAENLAPTGIRSPDRPARSESLCWPSYPGLVRTRVSVVYFEGLSCTVTGVFQRLRARIEFRSGNDKCLVT